MHCSSHLKIKSNFLFPGYNLLLLLLFYFIFFFPSVSHSLSTSHSLNSDKSLNLSLSRRHRHRHSSPPQTTHITFTDPQTHIILTDPQTHFALTDLATADPHRQSPIFLYSPISLTQLPQSHLALTQAASHCCRPSLFSLCYDCVFFLMYFHMGLVAMVVVVDFGYGSGGG